MTFKKIASLLVSATMAFAAFSAVASAETKGTLNLTTYQAYTAAEAAELGVDIPDTHGLFYIGFDFADIGPLSYQQSGTGLTAKYYGDKLTAVKIVLNDPVSFVMVDADSSALAFDTYSMAIEGGLKFEYLDTGVKTSFPTSKKTNVTETEGMVFGYVTAPLGTKVTPTVEYQVVSWDSTGTQTGAPWYTAAADEITLGEVASKELSLSIDDGTIYAGKGTVWNCTIANAANALKKLEVTFTDSNDKSENFFTTNGIGAWGGAGKTEFAIGVKSATRTVNAISATITDVEGATATDTAAAN